VCGQETS